MGRVTSFLTRLLLVFFLTAMVFGSYGAYIVFKTNDLYKAMDDLRVTVEVRDAAPVVVLYDGNKPIAYWENKIDLELLCKNDLVTEFFDLSEKTPPTILDQQLWEKYYDINQRINEYSNSLYTAAVGYMMFFLIVLAILIAME